MCKKWVEKENQVMKECYSTEGTKGVQKRLPYRSTNAIQQQAKKLGITGKIGRRFEDLTGKFFGIYEVVRRGKGYNWWIKCTKCGFEKLVKSNSLKNGRYVTCRHCPKLEIGKICGYLEPLEQVKDHKDRKSGTRFQRFRMKCHYGAEGCKGEFTTYAQGVLRGTTSSCGCLRREKTRKRGQEQKGENHPRRKPEGTHLTLLSDRYYDCIKYRRLQNKCFERDKYCCVILGKVPRKLLQIHHIIPRWFLFQKYNITTEEQMYACKELWDINNLVTISEEWHIGIRTYNSLALHKIHHGRVYIEENYYEWLEYMKK